ncbi:major capsid protein [Kushneria phyllosphaerae]|uniref:Major capsid protein n=1 Tax=Kushneria phyllosphaerae TaxID=2100822 RepID=A0A2R8CII6_9GAMM|nr:major capsid protein [Kushneria phyllosphaerae]SPJ32696.1 hypothetical protein KSP9073_00697 [Kushneria phyllosphaerae]
MALFNNNQIVDQTQSIQRIPNQPGLMGALGLYRDSMVGNDVVVFDVRDNSFHILEDKRRNVAQKNSTEERPYGRHLMEVPHYPIERTIGRERLAGVRQFGSDTEMTIAQAVAEELEQQSQNHDVTEEYLKAAMTIQGRYATTNFGTVDMADEFGVQRETEALATGDMLTGIRSAQRKAKNGLRNGGMTSGYIMLAGPELFEQILKEPDLLAAYQYSNSASNPLRNELGTVGQHYQMLSWGNLNIIMYEDTFSPNDGEPVELLASDAGVLFPRTTLGRCFFGPESTLTGLGAGGARRFARSFRDEHDRYVQVESEMNILPIAEQYGAVVDVTLGASA